MRMTVDVETIGGISSAITTDNNAMTIKII